MSGTSFAHVEIDDIRATRVRMTDDELIVELEDGRTISAPIVWYPRLEHGTPIERANCRIVGRGSAIRWPELDEDLSVSSIILGRKSGESPASFARWLEARANSGATSSVTS